MKKIISIIASVAVMAALFAGCAGDASTDSAASTSDTASVSSGETMTGDGTKSPDGYTKDFEGFVKYMTDNEFVSGDGEDLTAAAIGASSGKRFTVSSGVSGKHTIELYEFTDTTTAEAQKAINNAKNDHSFHLFESTEGTTKNTYAVVTENGHFMMLYTDTASNENESGDDTKEKAAEAVLAFEWYNAY